MSDVIRIGSRSSKLALWQTYHVASLLQKGGFRTEVITMETKGDKILHTSFAEIGTKGLFTEELEDKLKTGELDIAVHSAKDMQTEMAGGLELIAFSKREDPNDVLVSFDKNIRLDDLSAELVVGTSSTRRRAILAHYYPHLKVTEARGNLQTRFRKMEEGKYKAMILAYAGVHRMDYDEFMVQKLPLDIFTPAVGQGSITIESSANVPKEKRDRIRALINDPETESCILAERTFLRTLQGGCSVPIFALGNISGNELTLTGGVISLDGKVMIRETVSGTPADSEHCGMELARKVIARGGDKVLSQIRAV